MIDWGQLCKRLDSCWVETAAAMQRGDSGKSRCDCANDARALVQLAVFLQLCRHRCLLPKGCPDKMLDVCRNAADGRFGIALFRPQHIGCNDANSLIAPNTWQLMLTHLADIDGPPDILAHIHQWFLGRRLVPDNKGVLRSVPDNASQKAGGVFYTPDYVTRYMVGEALSRTNSTTPTLLDPSCGCGAFLLAAFRGIIAHRAPDADNLATRFEILQHIHGVDIDEQAVLVARQSLWLEMFDGIEHVIGQENVFDECGSAAAESLGKTVRVANTLANDFQQQAPAYDIIVGNPPYRRELGTKKLLDQIAQTSLGRRWQTARMDLWYYFVHRGLELLTDDGSLSFIVSGYWTTGSGAGKLIEQLRNEAHIEEIFDLGSRNVFENVNGRHMILRIRKRRCDKPTLIKQADNDQPHQDGNKNAKTLFDGSEKVAVVEKTAAQLFRHGRIDLEPPRDELLACIAQGTPLCSLGKVRQGIAENPSTINRRTHQKFDNRWIVGEGVFALTADEVAALELPEAEKKLLRPYHDLCDLGRYRLAETPSRYLIYSTAETWPQFGMYPVLGRHLERFRPIMENRRETRQGLRPWWQLHWPRDAGLWNAAKIICVQMAARPAFVPAQSPAYVPFSANVFVPDKGVQEHLNYFAAVLNSSLLWQWYRHHAKRRGVGLEINGRVLGETPIRRINFNSADDRDHHDRLVELVDKMLAPCGEDAKENEKKNVTDEIDAIVSGLYCVKT